MFRVARHPELLPHKQAHLVAELEKVVRLGNTSTPHTDKIYTALLGISQLGIGAFIGVTKHSFRNPISTTNEDALTIDIELARAVWSISIGSNLTNTKSHTCFVRNFIPYAGGKFQLVQLGVTLEKRPPKSRIFNDKLRKLLGSKGNDLCFATQERNLLLEGDILPHDFALDNTFQRLAMDCRTRHLDTYRFAADIVVRFIQIGANKRVTKHRFIGCIEADTLPNTRIAVANTIKEGKVPANAHQHRGIQADITVATIAKLARSTPLFKFCCTGHIDRIDLNCESVLLAHLHKFGNIYVRRLKHTRHILQQMAIHPHFGAIVYTLELQPHNLTFITLGHVKFCAEPIGVEISAGISQIGYYLLIELIIQAIVRIRIDLVMHQRVKHRSWNNCRKPLFHDITRLRNLLGSLLHITRLYHLPLEGSGVPILRVKIDSITLSIAVCRLRLRIGRAQT